MLLCVILKCYCWVFCCNLLNKIYACYDIWSGGKIILPLLLPLHCYFAHRWFILIILNFEAATKFENFIFARFSIWFCHNHINVTFKVWKSRFYCSMLWIVHSTPVLFQISVPKLSFLLQWQSRFSGHCVDLLRDTDKFSPTRELLFLITILWYWISAAVLGCGKGGIERLKKTGRKQGWFYICAQPIRNGVILWQRLSLAGRKPRISPGNTENREASTI